MVGYKLSKNDWVTPFFVIFRSVREILLVTVFLEHPVLAIIICLVCLCWVLPGMGSFAVDMNNAPHLGHHWYLPQPPVYSWFGSNMKSKLLHLYHCNRPRSIHSVSLLSVSPHFKCLDWIQIRLRDPNDGADYGKLSCLFTLGWKENPLGKIKGTIIKPICKQLYM